MPLNFPVSVIAHYTPGGSGHVIVNDEEELLEAIEDALKVSPVTVCEIMPIQHYEELTKNAN